jgi:hypothetical protein
MMPIMPDTPRRLLLAITSLAFLLMLILYFIWHQQAILAAALVSAGVDIVTLLQGYYVGTTDAIERWANDLAGQVAKTWVHRRDTLLSGAGVLITRFERDRQLEDGELPDGLEGNNWNGIQDFFLSLPEQKLVLLGDAGAGKTLITLQLVIGLLKLRTVTVDEGLAKAILERLRKQATPPGKEETVRNSSKRIPVPISVVGWDGQASLADWLIGRLRTAYLVPRRRANALVKKGYVLPVLDGLDEATSMSRGTPAALSILYRLNADFETTDSSGQRPLVLTCRTKSYVDLPNPGNARHLSRRLENAVVVKMQQLTESQVLDCLSRQAKSVDSQLALLIELLVDGSYDLIAKALANPLSLALALRVARSENLNISELAGLSAVQDIREYLIGEYPRSTAELYPKDYGRRKGVLAREELLVKKQDERAYYSARDVQRWLYYIARYMIPRRVSEARAISREPQLEPRDFWEIAASNDRPVRRTHILVAIVGALVTGTFGAEVTGGGAGVACWLIATVLALGFAMRVGLPQQPKMSQVDFRQLSRGKTAFYLLPIIAITGLLAGFLAFRISHQVSVGVTEGFAATALAVLLAGRSRGLARAIEPLDGLSNDLRFGVVVGIVGGIAIGFPGGLTGGLWSDLHLTGVLSKPGSGIVALLISIPCGVALGSGGWLRLQIAAALSRDQFMPRQPVSFLHWAEQTGLLRAAGTAYQFRHNDLCMWLLAHPDSNQPDGEWKP